MARILLLVFYLFSLSAIADNQQIPNQEKEYPKHEARESQSSFKNTQTEKQASNDGTNSTDMELNKSVVNYPALNLTEQRRMTDATENMAIDSNRQLAISEYNFWIGIGGLLVLFVALIYNIRAANAAKHSADAALAQNRAWIFVNSAITHIRKDQAHPFIIEIIGQNFGQSPAINLEIQTGHVFLDSVIDQPSLHISLDEETHPFGTVGQGTIFKKGFSILGTKELQSICAEGGKALYIRIFIKYLTIHSQVATSDNIIRVNYNKKFADLRFIENMKPEDFPANIFIVPGYTILT
jgi:hypothetical protein